jgi:octaprenyl-diphosphate synthase
MTMSTLQLVTQHRVDPRLLAEVSEEVAAVEVELQQLVRSQTEMVDRVGKTTLEAGGKRLRPAFVALAAQAAGHTPDSRRVVLMGAVMEMIHMATLIHDDVIDQATTRRGKPTAATEVGNTAAILSGDVLLAKAMVALAQDGDLSIIRTVSAAVVEMAEGEVQEIEARGNFDLSEEELMEILRHKTAGFIQCCCEVGAILSGASAADQDALSRYGHHIGMAFQLVDDVLDYRGTRSKTGKPVGGDFREGQATLPLIHLRGRLSEGEDVIARSKFGDLTSDDEIRMISDWMATRGSYAETERRAREHADLAVAALESLPQSRSRRLLETVAAYVLERVS